MSNIPVNDNPEFSQNMEALTPQTPAHADVFNAIFSQLLNNDYYLSLLAEKLAENLANHFEDYVAHITADERISWNNTLDNAKEYSDGAYQQATGYTDLKIAQLINGAPETLDTLKEVADAIKENETVVDALDAAIGTKASQAEFDTHAGNSTIHITAAERTNWNSKANGSHTHSYAGSSSAGGAANSAVKLKTPRTITIGKQSQPFDGSKNIAFDEKSMGLLKIAQLQTKNGDISKNGTPFAQIKCAGYYASGYAWVKNIFMIFNFGTAGTGGYYVSTSGMKDGNGSSFTGIGESANRILLEPIISGNDLIINLRSAYNGYLISVVYDAENVEVTQL